MGVVRRAAPSPVAEHRAVLAARDDVRRRRQEQLRPAAQQHAAVPDLLLQHRAAGRLPAAHLTKAVELRPVEPGDREFLYCVYASTRTEELAVVPWDEEQKAAFLRVQFGAQDAWYRENYADARFDVIVVGGERAGRFYVHCGPSEIRIVDIVL